ncbi:TPA: BC1872 family protein [Bacillus anthracis]|nr:hypothetical protein [Bacillus cereus biovar anthracis]HDR6230940.1 hypothetical protein [Bacillus cereus biovar anthracis]HDR6240467.1 hypothetical protein [Bacillus cereus biovar anthracis]HDR6252411.1 hypothetical protein [Bacillus cereus biovar anthracis]HDR6254196.1 hypothetical protein [Bacillus cereus biovar anthracis]
MENRELNILIAEKVMGWKVAVAMDGATEYYDNGTLCDGKWVDDVGILEKDNLNVFKPSDRIQDAWLVVEKMRKDYDFWFELTTHESFSLKTKCYFQLNDIEVSAVCETAPMAICKAALLAIEAKYKNLTK